MLPKALKNQKNDKPFLVTEELLRLQDLGSLDEWKILFITILRKAKIVN
jgi:hypothetical protein